jgi:hypothetical protein
MYMVHTWYVHSGLSKCMYIVQTCIYMYIHVYTRSESYEHVHTMYKYVYAICVDDVSCTDGYIHFMKCTDIIELCTYTDISFRLQLFIRPAGWPVG